MEEKKKIKIFQGDCLKVMKEMDDCTYTSILSDVPYGLSFMGKKWDYDVPSVEVFEEMYRITQHGGYLLCFGGSRTFHRIACNIEDAGWILKDTIMWLYGSGFPKSHNISKAIDKKYGLERDKVGEKKTSGKERHSMANNFAGEYYETKPNHQLAKDFKGYGTALKPAYEPIIIAHKPCEGSYVDNIEKHGIGGINIEESRIQYINEQDKKHQINIAKGQANATNGKMFGGNAKSLASSTNLQGRFPANVITDGSDEVSNAMDQQSGKGDVGGASHFFAKTPYSEKEIEPRFESIIVAHKPCEGSYVENIEKHGIGGLNINECRVDNSNDTSDKRGTSRKKYDNGFFERKKIDSPYSGGNGHSGRFPANVITDGSDEVCKTMDEQSGISKSSGGISTGGMGKNGVYGSYSLDKVGENGGGLGDVGGASRFFAKTPYSEKEIEPRFEPIIVAHKPCEGSFVENVMKHGIGGLNIDGTRILLRKGENTSVKPTKKEGHKGSGGIFNKSEYTGSINDDWKKGRFPANVITDGSEEVCGTIDQQSGILKGGGNINQRPLSVFGNTKGEIEFGGYKDSGGASRFFYCAKASQKEKNAGLERLQAQQRDSSRNKDQPSMNGGDGNPYNRGAKKVKNPHPTVKPIALMEYLAKLLKQPNGKTKILDPYCGSGTTLIACKRLDIECHGIEMNTEYVKIAKARLGEDLSEYDIKDEEKKSKNKLSQMTIWDFMQ